MLIHEMKSLLETLAENIRSGAEAAELEKLAEKLQKLNAEMQKEGFWNDQKHAQEVSKEANLLQENLDTWQKLLRDADELEKLLPTLHPEKDPSSLKDFEQMLIDLQGRWKKQEIYTFFSGKYDKNSALLSLHSGTGGKDAQDFAEMLLRMYIRYAEIRGYTPTILEISAGEEAGIKSATLLIEGPYVYGYLKSEHGVHRLIRLSPFNVGHTRETSFALVEVLPEIEEAPEVEITKEDLRIDVYRSGGHGGQSVNKTDSAVRIMHLPTGIVVACQTERSQLQNKNRAMKVLISKLVDLMEKEHAKTLADIKGKRVETSFGSQIRTYTLHPYKMVKDHRTEYEEHNPEAVLDGKLDGFIDAYLRQKS